MSVCISLKSTSEADSQVQKWVSSYETTASMPTEKGISLSFIDRGVAVDSWGVIYGQFLTA